MPLTIKKKKAGREESFQKIKPIEMLHPANANRIFQQYANDEPQEWYYINCGISEPSVIIIWCENEDRKYLLSTGDTKYLKEYNKHVMVVDVTDEIEIDITLNIK